MSNGSKILNWKQITTYLQNIYLRQSCVQWFKDTKLKANHNFFISCSYTGFVVSNGSKILNWKQITTFSQSSNSSCSCVQWFKDTKLKANHNGMISSKTLQPVVSNGSKILNWKQITTAQRHTPRRPRVVSNGSKILNWKQITTLSRPGVPASCCVQWFKDTKLKANHNAIAWYSLPL